MSTPPSNAVNRRNDRNAAKTPTRQAAGGDAASARRPVHTPLDRSTNRDLLNSVRRGTSASGGRRNNAPTPHATAARRALNDRRTAMFTPGKNRRRSQMEQRETPMALLRHLGRALAPDSNAVQTSSSPRDVTSTTMPIMEEDEEDELTIDAPRLSLALDADDDEPELQPPRSTGLEDENFTVQSVELPRRFQNEQLPRLSRGSVINDFPDDEDDDEEFGRPSDFFPGLLEDIQARADDAGDFTYERVEDPTRRTTLGRESDFGLALPEGVDDQTTFLLSEPAPEAVATSPIVEQEVTGAIAGDAREPVEDFVLVDDDGGDEPLVMGDADDDDNDIEGLPVDMEDVTARTAGDTTASKTLPIPVKRKKKPQARKNIKRLSRHGIEYPSLPTSFVKRVAQTSLQSSGLSNSKISADALTELSRASDWFFEQLGDDLGVYADHARRKTIEESDVLTLMKRQRQVGSNTTMFSLAQRHLPRELLQELRMPIPQPIKSRRGAKQGRRRTSAGDETLEIG